MRSVLPILSPVLVCGLVELQGVAAAPLPDAIVPNCLVIAKHDVPLPAQDAGVLIKLDAVEGMQVRKGYPLANIDDTESQMKKKVAEAEQQAAHTQATNDISVRFSTESAAVAKAALDERKAANRIAKGAATNEELRRLALDWHRSVLSIDQAKLDMTIAGFTTQARAVDVDAAKHNIERRAIKAPFDGEIVELMKKQWEWVNPGDTILRIMGFETLRIDGRLSASEFDHSEVDGRPVTVEVAFARGRKEQFDGRVVYASPEIDSGGQYKVWAEVTNRQENGRWLLKPGLDATMTIHLNSAIEAGSSPEASKGQSLTPVSTSRSRRD